MTLVLICVVVHLPDGRLRRRTRRRLRPAPLVRDHVPDGFLFVLGQAYEYFHLVTHGTTIPGSAYGGVFYLATGFHGLHVAAVWWRSYSCSPEPG